MWLCDKPILPLLNYIFLTLVSSWTYQTFTAKVEILSATLYKFFEIANFNVSPKHGDQEILLYITFCHNVPIHMPWV